MNSIFLRCFLFLFAGVAVLAFTGCDSLRPIESKPAREKISLGQPFTTTWKSSVMPLMKYSVVLPAGEYHPAFEDDKFYYYLAPSRVIFKDLNSSLLEGGVRVARNGNALRGWYCVSEDGTIFSGDFKTPLPVQ